MKKIELVTMPIDSLNALIIGTWKKDISSQKLSEYDRKAPYGKNVLRFANDYGLWASHHRDELTRDMLIRLYKAIKLAKFTIDVSNEITAWLNSIDLKNISENPHQQELISKIEKKLDYVLRTNYTRIGVNDVKKITCNVHSL